MTKTLGGTAMYGKTAERTRKFLSALCCIFILFTLFPAFPVSAGEEPYYTIYAGVSGIGAPTVPDKSTKKWTGDHVYFGVYNGTAIDFRVLNPAESAFGGETMLLDCETVLLADQPFGEKVDMKDWKDSLVKVELNTNFPDNSFNNLFTSTESTAIANSIKEDDGESGDYKNAPLNGEKIFILDYSEATSARYGYSQKVREKRTSWWLRSCHSISINNKVLYVKNDGAFDLQSPTKLSGVSPALNISRSSILFSSAADREKSVFSSTAATSDITVWKLTLLDGNTFRQTTVNGKVLSENGELSVTAGESLTLCYPALNGNYNHVTAALTDTAGNILYYGAVETDSGLTTSAVPIPSDLPAGNYTLSVYAEKWCGAYHTDYATSPFTCTLNVKAPCIEHKYDGGSVSKAATCTEAGEKTYKCKVCGATKSEDIPALGHSFGHWETKIPAACLTDGLESRTCSICGTIETRTIDKTDHTAGEPEIVGATCTGPGQSITKCTACGETIRIDALPVVGHTYGEWQVAKEPACTQYGEQVRTCSVCGKQENEAILPVRHTPGEKVISQPAGCTQPGLEIVSCIICCQIIEEAEIPALGHNWEQEWTADGESHWHTCTRCDAVRDKDAHTGGTATETELAKCEVCGISYGSLVQHTHNLEHTDAKKPTCLTSGNLEFWFCLGCKKYFADSLGEEELPSDSIVQLASGHHKWKDGWVTDGASHWHICEYCGEIADKAVHMGGTASETEQAVCTVCGTSYGNLLRHTHVMEYIGAKLPTCLEAGNIEYWYCSACGQSFSDAGGNTEIRQEGIALPALGHNWTEWRYNAESHWQVCSRCAKESETAAHKGAWVQDIASTETRAGSQHTTCPDCGYTQTAEIPVLGHTHVLTPIPAKAPTCTESGNRAYFVCTCGKLFSDAEAAVETILAETVLNPLGHAFSGWTAIQQASTLEKGLEKRVCDRCQTSEYRDIPAVSQTVPSDETGKEAQIDFPETDEEPAFVSEPVVSVKNGWKNVGKNTAYYQNGKKATGWNEVDGKTYFFDEKGRLQTEWVQVDGQWFYLDPDTGAQASGWQKIGNSWYYLEADTGAMSANGIQQVDGETYYFYDWGGMAGNFWYAEEETGQWYFFRSNGAMAKSAWTLWKGKWYYSGADGAMLTDTMTPDGYYVDENGVWIP